MAINKAPASAYGTSVTSGAANTKGSYAELLASTSEEARNVVVNIGKSDSNRKWLVDYATGAAASETVVIADVIFDNAAGNDAASQTFLIPLNIAASTRISSRCQNGGGTFVLEVALFLIGGTGGATTDTYGADTANSEGTNVDPGTTANTKGSYVELTASTGITIKYLAVCIGQRGQTLLADGENALDIATGAAASETVVMPDLYYVTDAAKDTLTPHNWSMNIDIASSTRIAARAQCTYTTSNRIQGVAVIGSTEAGGDGSGSGGGEASHVF